MTLLPKSLYSTCMLEVGFSSKAEKINTLVTWMPNSVWAPNIPWPLFSFYSTLLFVTVHGVIQFRATRHFRSSSNGRLNSQCLQKNYILSLTLCALILSPKITSSTQHICFKNSAWMANQGHKGILVQPIDCITHTHSLHAATHMLNSHCETQK